MKRLVLLAMIGLSVVSAAGTGLSAEHRSMFCGSQGAEETSLRYAEAINAEISRQLSAGAKTTAEALSRMRSLYCSGSTK